MVTPTFDIGQRSRVRSTGSARADGDCLRYRLDVVATSAIDVVQSAGGWLYDRMMAGWEVTVLLPQGCDSRPLRILGARAMDLEEQFAMPGPGSTSQSLAVSAAAFTADARVRDKVLKSLDNRLTEVALWGDGWPPGVNRGLTPAQHLLSAAARKFKGYALAAAGTPCDSVDPIETLQCDRSSRLDSALIRLV